jgi:putative addiction module component (TIGR02574 family)
MSAAEIVVQLPKLTPEERRAVRRRLDELEGNQWLDDGELTETEKQLLQERLEAYEADPNAGSPWAETKARILARLHAR